ncbi:MAG TPA: hypothetical protein VJR89_06295, partial [Polyangiales bacterium]|nr:hypothetical protein [Polyangiales bacterium]
MRVCGGKIAVLLAWFFPLTALADESHAAVATLNVQGQRDHAEIVIDGSFKVPKYSIDALADGKRVVIHVEDAVLGPQGLSVNGTSALVLRTGASTDARGVRIDILLTRQASYRARSEDGKIRVFFDARDAQPSAEPAASPLTAASPRAPTVQYVGIERRNGRERVVVELDRPAEFRIVPGTTDAARMELQGAVVGARVPSRVQGEANAIVREVRVGTSQDRVTLTVDRAGAGNATAIREGNRIVWLFAGDDSSPQRATNARRTETIAREAAVDVDG